MAGFVERDKVSLKLYSLYSIVWSWS